MLDATYPSAIDRVIAAVKNRIRDAHYSPGQRLIEPELVAELGVSRGSVREALHRLTAEGLVEWTRFKGASIIRMSARQVSDFLELRELIEGCAAGCAARRLDADGRRSLVQLQRSPNARSKLPGNYDAYNNEFHALVLRLSGNAEISGVLDHTRLPIFRLQFNKVLLQPDQIAQSKADHARVVQHILKRNPKGAESAMRVHIQHSAACMLAAPSHFFAH
jgi:DNA-binding GntR family transcriptional regulator